MNSRQPQPSGGLKREASIRDGSAAGGCQGGTHGTGKQERHDQTSARGGLRVLARPRKPAALHVSPSEVRVTGNGRSHWVAKAPAGQQVEWDAEIVEDRPGELIAWRALRRQRHPARGVGAVQRRRPPIEAPRSTSSCSTTRRREAPARSSRSCSARSRRQQIRDDLRRFKQVMETGEVVLSDGSLEGAGQGPRKQRAAQAPEAEVRR